MDIYVKFVVWNVTSKAFEPVASMPVDLMDNDPVSDDLIDTQTTDSNGCVHFSETQVTLKQKSGEDTPDLFFNARPKGLTSGGTSLPDAWSTKGWNDQSGKPGFYPNAPFTAGDSLGSTAAAPLVFAIGLDFHCRFEAIGPRLAPKGLSIGIWPDPTPLTTDANGEVHGVTFQIGGGQGIFPIVYWQIQDSSINLPKSIVTNTTGGNDLNAWQTSEDDGDKKVTRTGGEAFFPNNANTSLGTQTNPEIFICSMINNRAACMFFLTMLYEHTCFFFHITNGAWTGVSNMAFFPSAAAGTAYSWPVGEVNIPPSDFTDRGTLMHEISHQVMWKEVGISSLNIAGQVISPQGLCLTHYEDMLANPTHAVIEGWAEIFEGIFEPMSLHFTSSSTVAPKGGSPVPLGPPPANQGQSVEGAFAQGVIGVFNSFVVGSAGSPTVPASVNGDVTTTASWITDAGVQSRFKSAIWDPLHALNSSTPTTTDFLAKMKSSNPGDWPSMLPKLNLFNLALEAPTVTAISPPSGPAAGGQAVTITGTNFISGATVTIGGNAATSPSVVNSTTITCNTPAGSAGTADVVVTTAAGTGKLPGGYTYTAPTTP